MPLLPPSLPLLPSFQKQHLLVEFSSLRYAQLDGVFVSITPGDPSLWAGVLFVRKGPYAPAVLRFQISFPSGYPTLPPLVTFSTDVFHPLLTPLTTHTYTIGSADIDTASATEERRLPPGGFSLRHGFPHWFRQAQKSLPTSYNASLGHRSMISVLEYIQSTFNDASVLDALPIEAAANPGAYHAWRTYRGLTSQNQFPSPGPPTSHIQEDNKAVTENSTLSRNRHPGAWNWEGVWEDRVRIAVRASLSELSLYGSNAGEDIIHFCNSDKELLEKISAQLEATSRNHTES